MGPGVLVGARLAPVAPVAPVVPVVPGLAGLAGLVAAVFEVDICTCLGFTFVIRCVLGVGACCWRKSTNF